jgi:hypothetical protein
MAQFCTDNESGCLKTKIVFAQPQVLALSALDMLVLIHMQPGPKSKIPVQKYSFHQVVDQGIDHRPGQRDKPG